MIIIFLLLPLNKRLYPFPRFSQIFMISKDKKFKNNYIIICGLIFLCLMGACSDNDFDRPHNPDTDIMITYPEGIKALIEAHSNEKTISNILFIPKADFTGDLGNRWLITFTDGNSITLLASEFITPYFRVNNEGIWTLALDGKNFENVKDNSGDFIKALAGETDREDPFQNEVDLIFLYPHINIQGTLSYEISCTSHPSEILQTVGTEVNIPSTTELFSIVQNDYAGKISFYLTDNISLDFNYKNRWPYSFGIISSEETIFNSPGDTVSIEFFITPSNLDFKLDSESPDLDLKLIYINGTEAINYSSYPVELSEIGKVTDEKGDIVPGRYRVNLKDHGDNLFTYNEPVTLSLSYIGVDRKTITLSSEVFELKYNSESPLIISSEISIMKITAPRPVNSKDIWTEDCAIEILNAGDYSKIYSKVQLKGRGNSTWDLPKKPYAIKLDKKEEMLGFPKHKRWVLLANYYDKTNLRNEIAFFMGRLGARQSPVGMDYIPRSSFIRLFFNNKFQGLYQLTEQLKIDDNRVNVGDDGFLLEVDFRAPEEVGNIYFRVPNIDNYIVVKDPDIEHQSDLDYIKDFMNEADSALFSENFTDPQAGYKKYLDINSFIDWYLINEITKNADANYWSSCYMHLSRGGKLKMGPLWDYDLAAGNYPNFGDWWYTQWVNTTQDFHIKNVKWYERLFQDTNFVEVVKKRFKFYYEHQNEIYNEIDRQKKIVSEVLEENEKIWFFFSRPFDPDISNKAYESSCEELKNWLKQRFQWLNAQFDKL